MSPILNLPPELLQPLYERAYNLVLSDPFMPTAIKENNNVAMWKVVTREFKNQQVTSHFIREIDRDYESAPSTKPKVLELFHRMFGTLREGLGAMRKSADDANPFLHRELIVPMTRLNAQCALDSIRGLETALSQLQRVWLQARKRGGSLDIDECFMPLQLSNLYEFKEINKLTIRDNDNLFTPLEADAFVGFSQLTCLDLESNHIQAIQPGAFAALEQLQKLDLSRNQLTHINQGSFDGLSNLSALYLTGNQIQAIQSGAFAALEKLQKLDLKGNKLTLINQGYFEGLTNLSALYLT